MLFIKNNNSITMTYLLPSSVLTPYSTSFQNTVQDELLEFDLENTQVPLSAVYTFCEKYRLDLQSIESIFRRVNSFNYIIANSISCTSNEIYILHNQKRTYKISLSVTNAHLDDASYRENFKKLRDTGFNVEQTKKRILPKAPKPFFKLHSPPVVFPKINIPLPHFYQTFEEKRSLTHHYGFHYYGSELENSINNFNKASYLPILSQIVAIIRIVNIIFTNARKNINETFEEKRKRQALNFTAYRIIPELLGFGWLLIIPDLVITVIRMIKNSDNY